MTSVSRSHTQGITTALIYTRVSSDEQAREGLSLDAQLDQGRRYVAQRDGWVIGGEYQDVMTGTRDDRPDYQRMLADVRRLRAEGRRVAVVVARLDRLGRRLLERVARREELKGLGVATHAVREGGEVSDLVANILAVTAQEEVERLSQRVRDVREHIAANGWHPVGWPAWGYRWRDATADERRRGAPAKVLDVNELEATYVREAFERAARGETIRGVTIWLAGLPDAARGGRRMSYPATRRTLMAPVYVARLEGSTLEDPPGNWPPLVDDATWQRVQDQIASHTRLPRQATGRYLLTGFLRCQRCGSRMTGATSKRIPARYRCRASDRGASAPNPRCSEAVTAPKLDVAVLAHVEAVMVDVATNDPSLRARVRKEWQAMQEPAGQDASVAKTIQSLEREAERARERLKRAALLLVDGDIDRAGYEMLRDQAQADLRGAEAELERLRGRKVERVVLPSLDEVLSQVGGWSGVLQGGDTITRRDLLALLVERVEPIRISHGRFEAAITWTPLGQALREVAAKLKAKAA
jgi:site-specific DNA recombinase